MDVKELCLYLNLTKADSEFWDAIMQAIKDLRSRSDDEVMTALAAESDVYCFICEEACLQRDLLACGANGNGDGHSPHLFCQPCFSQHVIRETLGGTEVSSKEFLKDFKERDGKVFCPYYRSQRCSCTKPFSDYFIASACDETLYSKYIGAQRGLYASRV